MSSNSPTLDEKHQAYIDQGSEDEKNGLKIGEGDDTFSRALSNNQGEIRKVSASIALDPAAEKALVWKFDLRILPTLAMMYLFNSLDKSNLGNAKTAGLEKDLHLKDEDYNTILSIFFVPYVLTAPFLGMLGKKYGSSRVLPCMMFGFGFCTMMVVAAKSFSSLLCIRWFLGMFESAFFPLVIYYQTTFYRRGELARRLAIFYAASSIASAFGMFKKR